jgi:phosphonate transport system substrate-binding protein
MIEMLKSGEVDVYLDSLYPTLRVRQLSGSRVILTTWVRDQREYHSIFVVRRDGRVRKLSDLRGRVIAFEEAHSTSGFFLPALHLRRGGHGVEELASADAKPEAGAIGYVFSGDAENTVERVLRGSVDAGAISNEDYDALPEASRARLTVLDHTASIPRRLVSVRRGLPEAVTRALSAALLAMAEEEPVMLDDALRAWSWKFDPLTPDVMAGIEQLATFIVEP